ncbi:MAG: hypothetical protein Q6K08_08075, partial [Thermostichales cyanobacterium GMQP_bins_62]
MASKKAGKTHPNLPPNLPKYYSYRMAWARIKTAMEQGFYLEVVAIAEAIIADRLTSQIYRLGQRPPKNHFSQLIQCWKKCFTEDPTLPDADLLKEAKALIEEIDAWRQCRNRVVHGIVQNKQGQYASYRHPDPSADNQPDISDFLATAQQAALTGRSLARRLSAWDPKLATLLKASPNTSFLEEALSK